MSSQSSLSESKEIISQKMPEDTVRCSSPIHFADCGDVTSCDFCHDNRGTPEKRWNFQEPFNEEEEEEELMGTKQERRMSKSSSDIAESLGSGQERNVTKSSSEKEDSPFPNKERSPASSITKSKESLALKDETRPKSFTSFNFFKDRSGSFHKARPTRGRAKASKLSSHSFHAPSVSPANSNTPSQLALLNSSKFFVSTPMACVPLGVYVASDKEESLSRTLSLRLDKKLLWGEKERKIDPGRPPHGLMTGSRSLEALMVESNDGKQPRGVSLRRLARSRQGHDTGATSDSNATQSDHEFKLPGPIIRVGNGLAHSEPSLGSSRIGSWATSFEKLLEDPAGLHTFAEFLKKEYSHENIYFWTACERYKYVEDDEHRKELAKNIFKRHLGLSASEPVNVDSHARQLAQDGLSNPDEFLFVAAQKQIFNLMKFDSYSRFLKSELYNTCLSQERKGLPLPYPGGEALDSDLWILENQFSKELKKSKSDTDDRRRKSLLPWHRKDRSKSKDRSESDLRRGKKSGRTVSESSSARYDLSDSRTSLSSSDRAMSKESLTSGEAVSLSGSDGLSLCRFVLPDQSNSVLAVRPGESIKDLVRQLLERRRINFTDFNVVLTKGNKPVDLNKDSTVLGGLEARVERMVLFSLHLPSRKTVIVKAKPHKLASDVLKPILSKYGLKLDLMFIYKSGDASGINVKDLVTELDGQKLIVQTKEEIKEWTDPARQPRSSSSLDEITNRVFEDLLNGKTKSNFDDLGVLDFDSRSTKTEPTSETSSSLLGNINRRESLSLERSLPSRHSEGGRALISDHSFGSKRKENKDHSNFNAKTKQENADLYEGLKRAQLFRLDDQRGTEINFELPDFLKADQSQGAATTLLSHFDRSFDFISSDATDRSEFLSRAHPEVWGGVQDTEGADTTLTAPADLDLDDFEETLRSNKENQVNSDVNIIKNNLTINNNNKFFSNNNNNKKFAPSQSPYLTPPPPLPPKPKFGAALRGPPPRPPSRQLTSLSRSVQLLDMPLQMRSSNQSLTDKFSVSFV